MVCPNMGAQPAFVGLREHALSKFCTFMHVHVLCMYVCIWYARAPQTHLCTTYQLHVHFGAGLCGPEASKGGLAQGFNKTSHTVDRSARTEQIIKACVEIEVANTLDASTMFRRNNMSLRILKHHLHKVGAKFLEVTAAPPAPI